MKDYQICFCTTRSNSRRFFYSVLAKNIRDAWRFCRVAHPSAELVFISARCRDLNRIYNKVR